MPSCQKVEHKAIRIKETIIVNRSARSIIPLHTMASTSEKFPVKNKQAARTVQGMHTEVLVSSYADKIFIVVSQYGRIGSLVRSMTNVVSG
jgi:hypothetical protein